MPTYDVTIEARIRKTLRIEAESKDEAADQAVDMFNVMPDDNDVYYVENVMDIETVGPLVKRAYWEEDGQDYPYFYGAVFVDLSDGSCIRSTSVLDLQDGSFTAGNLVDVLDAEGDDWGNARCSSRERLHTEIQSAISDELPALEAGLRAAAGETAFALMT